MRWLRSYPSFWAVQSTRPCIYMDTHAERILIDDYDYTPLGEIDDDILLIEWDIAASKEMLADFQGYAGLQPDLVHVAAHRLYHIAPNPVWAHRWYDGETGQEGWVRDSRPFADLFAFGMIYLPKRLIQQFLAAPAPERGRPPHVKAGSYSDSRFTDQTFSMWHYKQHLVAMLHWDIQPVHLHF